MIVGSKMAGPILADTELAAIFILNSILGAGKEFKGILYSDDPNVILTLNHH